MASDVQLEASPAPLKLGFLTLRQLSDKSYRAGLLVTDARGRPLELRATEAVRPDAVQVLIYGSSLIPTIAEDLCGGPLIQSLRERPDVIVADHESFLGLDSEDLPLVYVAPASERLEIEGVDAGWKTVVTAESTSVQPLVLGFSRTRTEEERRELKTLLAYVLESMDLLEPFDRVARALQLLHEQAGRK